MKISCVIVTYNRLSLLQECISALKVQTYPLDKIFIIDNNSTDGTKEYLQSLEGDKSFAVITSSENRGGAWGFSEGIKKAILDGSDWVWVMDDDTIPTPSALSELVKGTRVTDHVGYICSKVIWTDGMIHKMNVPSFYCSRDRAGIPMNYYSNIADVLLVKSASFVSLLINAQAVYEVGLPIKDFFIWGDDSEFTSRIFCHGYTCLYAGTSVVVHKTPENYISLLQTAPPEAAWKFRYGMRNDTYVRRIKKKNFLLFLFSTMNTYRKAMRRLDRRPDHNKQLFVPYVRQGLWEGLSFKPQIEYLPK